MRAAAAARALSSSALSSDTYGHRHSSRGRGRTRGASSRVQAISSPSSSIRSQSRGGLSSAPSVPSLATQLARAPRNPAAAATNVIAQTPLRSSQVRQAEVPPPSVKEQHDFLDCARKYDFARVRSLVLENPGLVNCQPAGRWSALQQAARHGDVKAVEFLLAHGANPNAWTMDGRSVMDLAAPSVRPLLQGLVSSEPPWAAPTAAMKSAPAIACASAETIAALPLKRCCGKDAYQENECGICLEQFTRGQRFRVLPCSHVFHAECVDVWLKEKSASCPTCRHQLT